MFFLENPGKFYEGIFEKFEIEILHYCILKTPNSKFLENCFSRNMPLKGRIKPFIKIFEFAKFKVSSWTNVRNKFNTCKNVNTHTSTINKS